MPTPETALAVAPHSSLARSELRPLPARVRYPTREDWLTIRELAAELAQDPMFKERGLTQGGITAIALKGYELGFPFMSALDAFDYFKGRPRMRSTAMEGLAVARVPGAWIEWSDTGETGTAVCLAHRAGRPPVKVSFSWEDAERAGLANKDLYQKYPSDMLRERALSRACKLQYAEIYFGFEVSPDIIDIETEQGFEKVELVGPTPLDGLAEPKGPPPAAAVKPVVVVEQPTAAAPEQPAAAPAPPPEQPAAPVPVSAPVQSAPVAAAPTHPTDRLLQFTIGPFIGKHLSDLNEKEIRQLAKGFLASLDKAKADKNQERIDNYSKWLELVEQWAGFRRIKLAPAGAGA